MAWMISVLSIPRSYAEVIPRSACPSCRWMTSKGIPTRDRHRRDPTTLSESTLPPSRSECCSARNSEASRLRKRAGSRAMRCRQCGRELRDPADANAIVRMGHGGARDRGEERAFCPQDFAHSDTSSSMQRSSLTKDGQRAATRD